MVRANVSGCQACSYVDHWLLGQSDPSRPRRTSQPLLGATGPAPTPPRSRRTGCSLLCFEEAVISATSWAERASMLEVEPARNVRSSLRRDVPPPRTQHGFGAILENCIASTSVLKEVAPWSSSPEEDMRSVRFQVTKSQRWMPWRQVPMKDVGGCEKPRGAVYQALIRGSPNGETRLG